MPPFIRNTYLPTFIRFGSIFNVRGGGVIGKCNMYLMANDSNNYDGVRGDYGDGDSKNNIR